MNKILFTDRLLIRPLAIDDRVFILGLLNSNGWLRFIGDRGVKNNQDAEEYILKILANKTSFYHVFELKETKQPIGVVTFMHRANQSFPDIGFALLPDFEKKGYAFEASQRYLSEIIQTKVYAKIIAIVQPDNAMSIKLIEKLGLKYQTEFIDNETVKHLYELSLEGLE